MRISSNKENKFQRGVFETYFIFILSPFLSIPFIFFQLYKKRGKMMIALISLLMGMLSFQYVPSISNDKVRYFERYYKYMSFNLNDFINDLKWRLRPDFIFDGLNYIFSKLAIDFNYFFFFITSLTIYSFLTFIKKINNHYLPSSNLTLTSIVLFLCSLSLPGVFSGVRFAFAGSIFIWSVYHFFFSKNILKGALFCLIAVLTHFSYSFFIPPILLLLFYSQKINSRILLGVSIIFIFLPKDFLINIFDALRLPESYTNKSNTYLLSEQEQSSNAIILNYIRNFWLYFSYLYFLFLNKNRKDTLLLIIMVLLTFTNITYSVPVVFNRYSIIIKLLLVVYLIYSKYNGKIGAKYFYIFFILFLFHFVADITVLRNNFLASYDWKNLITIVNVFAHKITINDFLP